MSSFHESKFRKNSHSTKATAYAERLYLPSSFHGSKFRKINILQKLWFTPKLRFKYYFLGNKFLKFKIYLGFFVPYLLLATVLFATPAVSNAPRTM